MKYYLYITFTTLLLIGCGTYLESTYVDQMITHSLQQKVHTPIVSTPTDALHRVRGNNVVIRPIAVLQATLIKQVPIIPLPTLGCGQGGSCSEEDVAKHHTRDDCYVSMENLSRVYNITAYVADSSPTHTQAET